MDRASAHFGPVHAHSHVHLCNSNSLFLVHVQVDSDHLVLFLSYSEPGLLSKVKARDKKIDSRIEERFEKDMTTSPLVYIRKGSQPAEPTSNPPDSTQSPLESESSQPNTTTRIPQL